MFVIVTNRHLAIHSGPLLQTAGRVTIKHWLAGGVFDLDEGIGLLPEFLRRWAPPTEELLHRFKLCIEWKQMISIRATDPWPNVTVSWRHQGVRIDEVLEPTRDRFAEAQEGVLGLLDYAEAHRPRVNIDRGWARYPDVPLEDATWPSDTSAESKTAYRTSSRSHVVALREPGGVADALRVWWGVCDEWNGTVREAVVTREQDLIVRLKNGYARVPLSALRARTSTTRSDVYTFGRRTRIVFPRRTECAVCDHMATLVDDAL